MFQPGIGFRPTEVSATIPARAWTALRFSLVPRSLSEIAHEAVLDGAVRQSRCRLGKRIEQWRTAGFVIRTSQGKYLMTKEARGLRTEPKIERFPEAKTGVGRIWRAVRGLRRQSFTIDDIAFLTDVPPPSANCYIIKLERAGYLRRVSAPGAPRRWRVVDWTGPKWPRHIRNNGRTVALFDRNTGDTRPLADLSGQTTIFFEGGR